MTPYETLMVRVLDHMTPEEIDGPVESLGNIAATIGYPVEVVRAVAKDAKGMGYCKLSTLVNLDEGYPMGSGYLRTGGRCDIRTSTATSAHRAEECQTGSAGFPREVGHPKRRRSQHDPVARSGYRSRSTSSGVQSAQALRGRVMSYSPASQAGIVRHGRAWRAQINGLPELNQVVSDALSQTPVDTEAAEAAMRNIASLFRAYADRAGYEATCGENEAIEWFEQEGPGWWIEQHDLAGFLSEYDYRLGELYDFADYNRIWVNPQTAKVNA